MPNEAEPPLRVRVPALRLDPVEAVTVPLSSVPPVELSVVVETPPAAVSAPSRSRVATVRAPELVKGPSMLRVPAKVTGSVNVTLPGPVTVKVVPAASATVVTVRVADESLLTTLSPAEPLNVTDGMVKFPDAAAFVKVLFPLVAAIPPGEKAMGPTVRVRPPPVIVAPAIVRELVSLLVRESVPLEIAKLGKF